jgi:hypothetical protein
MSEPLTIKAKGNVERLERTADCSLTTTTESSSVKLGQSESNQFGKMLNAEG